MTVIISKQPGGRILWAAETTVDGDKRFLRIRRQYGDGAGQYETDEWLPMPWSTTEPLLCFMETDLDEKAVYDVYQSVRARRERGPTVRREKPDIQKYYQDMNEARAAELVGRKHFGLGG